MKTFLVSLAIAFGMLISDIATNYACSKYGKINLLVYKTSITCSVIVGK